VTGVDRFDAIQSLKTALAVFDDVRDIVETRVDEARAPDWCLRRNWTDFLLQLSDSDVADCEAHGLAARVRSMEGVPRDLLELASNIQQVISLPALGTSPHELSRTSRHAIMLRKQAQLSALLGALLHMGSAARRIVDVGSGSGHLTRLAAELFGRETIGVERNSNLVEAASARLGDKQDVRFVLGDACESLVLEPSDLALGLHACGILGDRLVRAAVLSGCDLCLVSCCFQKTATDLRAAASRTAAHVLLRRDVLGLANLTSQAQGVEVSIEATMRARNVRFALRRLLRARGVVLEPGAEMHGLNRRRARVGLSDVAQRALAMRGLDAATDAELAEHEAAASTEYAEVRRLSLPRSMLSRLVEVVVVLDRAASLQESGAHVLVATVCDRKFTPRNLGIFASRDPARLPSI
jgi:protein-L-isoaspartate O-methyltransferase